jgi:hypothetical protein
VQSSDLIRKETTTSSTSTLERRIEQLFEELLTVWKESDTKKIESVRRLAAKLEQQYLQENPPRPINTISADIRKRLEEAGVKTAHHVNDYLQDKYKRDYTIEIRDQVGLDFTDMGKVNKIEEILRKDPIVERSRDEVQELEDYCKKLEVAREANRSAAQIRKIALDHDTDTFTSSTSKNYNKTETDNPHRHYKGPVHEAMSYLVEDLGKWYLDLKECVNDVYDWFDPKQVPEQKFVRVIEDMRLYIMDARKIIAPAKDLKFATSKHNWFHTLLKFLAHGKHAGAVMTSIQAHRHAEKRPLTREQVGDVNQEVEDLLENYADSKVFLNHIKSFFRANKEWDRDDRIRKWRAEFCSKLVRYYADDGDFYNWLSFFREKTMDPNVASRRIEARPTLSGLA